MFIESFSSYSTFLHKIKFLKIQNFLTPQNCMSFGGEFKLVMRVITHWHSRLLPHNAEIPIWLHYNP